MKGRYGMKKKRMAIAVLAAGLSASAVMPAFAEQWKKDSTRYWYQNDDGSYPAAVWQWLDGNGGDISFIDDDPNTDYHYIFLKDENGDFSNQTSFIATGNLKELITGLTKEEYTASELEKIVRQAGATNIQKTEKAEKEKFIASTNAWDMVWTDRKPRSFVHSGVFVCIDSRMGAGMEIPETKIDGEVDL